MPQLSAQAGTTVDGSHPGDSNPGDSDPGDRDPGDSPPAATPPGAAADSGAASTRGDRRLLDRVKAVIGDRVVLESKVQRELARSLGSRDLNDAERRREELAIMRQIAREEIWVQVGKVIGADDPKRFEEHIDRYVDEYVAERIEEYGSHAEMDRELREAQTSWQALRAEQRARILRDSARAAALRSRFQDGASLMVTPREMLRYYRAHPEEFSAAQRADVAWMVFRRGQEAAAREARQAWTEEPLADVEEIAARFGGVGVVSRGVRQEDDDPTRQLIKDFAREREEGELSDLVTAGDNVYVLRVLRKESREARGFSDAQTQSYIRNLLVTEKIDRLETRILAWKSQSILVEPRELFSGR